jgi:S-adenosylmethionine/arginine decarboxylase-like enzyme
LSDVYSQSASRVVLLCEQEWEITGLTKEFVEELNKKNVQLKIVHGSFRNQYYEDFYAELGVPINDVDFWGTHWINGTYYAIDNIYRPEFYVPNPSKFKYKFISLNNRSHLHRCAFIDEMAGQNQLDKGIVTWVKHLNENSDYPYKYFDNRQVLLDDGFVTKLNSFLLPTEWHESALHVVVESTTMATFITEKTAIPLLLKKPFLVFGAMGFNQCLQKLGFELYDNVFDYSFDSISDTHERAKCFVNNLRVLENYSPREIYSVLIDKTIRNYNRALEILLDNSFIPESVMDFYKSGINNAISSRIGSYLNVNIKKLKFYSVWENNPDYLTEVKNQDTREVIVDNTVETRYTSLQHSSVGVQNLATVCHSENVPLTLLSAGYRFNKEMLDDTIAERIKIVDHSCYWIAIYLDMLTNQTHYQENLNRGYDIFDKDVGFAQDIDYLYITLNNIAKYHRCVMMDFLSKYELIDQGAIVWRGKNRGYDNVRESLGNTDESGYDFKYWTPTRMFLDIPNDNTSTVNQNLIPNEFKNSFMQLVAESEHRMFFISEKTVLPIIANKPFLVVSDKNFHKNLKELGFELFDELFDYSFDNIDDVKDRIEKLVLNVHRYRNHNKEELRELTNLVKPKLIHNRECAKTYLKEIIDMFTPYMYKLAFSNIHSRLELLARCEKNVNRFS